MTVNNKQKSRGGLVGYDAALTQLRSGVRFPSTVHFVFDIGIIWIKVLLLPMLIILFLLSI